MPIASPTSSASAATFAPTGGPVPAELLGKWYLPTAAVSAAAGGFCRAPVTYQTCNLRLTLDTTTYSFVGTYAPGPGDVVVNNSEVDFFNAPQCDFKGAQGVGQYRWTLTGGGLHLKALNSDPCGRGEVLTNQTFYRTL